MRISHQIHFKLNNNAKQAKCAFIKAKGKFLSNSQIKIKKQRNQKEGEDVKLRKAR